MIYLFNSIDFMLFFIILFLTYWTSPRRLRNPLLLAASYIFYASWSWKALSLILASTLFNYMCGRWIYNAKNTKSRKALLFLSVAFNLSMLGFFKYFNFFAENLAVLLNSLGLNMNFTTLNIILPIGISFYTFQAMSYTIDIYRGQFTPISSIRDFSLFIAYFPQLIAGPIERAKNLIPRIQAPKIFKEINFRESAYLFVYGLFQKIVIADTAAMLVDRIYSMGNPTGAQVLIATYAFALQIYCDFCGYSNMARGISGFFGIQLSMNFNLPYLSKNPAEFWRRWHITLSSWVRDYVYKPLGGRKSFFYGFYSLFITWLLMGLWHGAAWHFVVWGVYWFALIAAYRVIRKLFTPKPTFFTTTISVVIMFHLALYGWVLFRAQTLAQAFSFTKSLLSGISISGLFSLSYLHLYAMAIFLLVYELMQHYMKDELFITKKGFYWQMAFYLVLFFLYVEIGAVSNAAFIYFQF